MVFGIVIFFFYFFFQAEDGIRDRTVTGVQTCALPISHRRGAPLQVPSPRLRNDLELKCSARELLPPGVERDEHVSDPHYPGRPQRMQRARGPGPAASCLGYRRPMLT